MSTPKIIAKAVIILKMLLPIFCSGITIVFRPKFHLLKDLRISIMLSQGTPMVVKHTERASLLFAQPIP